MNVFIEKKNIRHSPKLKCLLILFLRQNTHAFNDHFLSPTNYYFSKTYNNLYSSQTEQRFIPLHKVCKEQEDSLSENRIKMPETVFPMLFFPSHLSQTSAKA